MTVTAEMYRSRVADVLNLTTDNDRLRSELQRIADIAKASTTANSLPNIAKIASDALAGASAPAPQPPVEGLDDDPSADAKWQAGLDFAMEQFCHVLRVDPKDVNWDAATEELEGDVRSVIGNILRAKYGEDFNINEFGHVTDSAWLDSAESAIQKALEAIKPDPKGLESKSDGGDWFLTANPVEIEITGPYHYPHETHPCFRLSAKDRIFASVYFVDDDEERGRQEAELIRAAMRLGGKAIERAHYAEESRQTEIKPGPSDASSPDVREDEFGYFDLGRSFDEEYQRAHKDGALSGFICAESPVEVIWHLINERDQALQDLQLAREAALSRPVSVDREEIARALKPFATFSDPHRKLQRDFKITSGSGLAKPQLTMGDCYDAADALALLTQQPERGNAP